MGNELSIIKEGERDDGELVYKEEIKGPQGTSTTREVNVTKLLSPGKRTTSNVEILVEEAKQHADNGVDNPAYPRSAEVANEACQRIIEQHGLEPAWKDHEPEEHP